MALILSSLGPMGSVFNNHVKAKSLLASNKNEARAKIVPQRQIEVANTKALVFTFLKEAKAASLKQNKANLVEVEVLQFSIFFFTFWSQKMLM